MSAKSKHKPVTLAKSVQQYGEADLGSSGLSETPDVDIEIADEKLDKPSSKYPKASKSKTPYTGSDVTTVYRSLAERSLNQARQAYSKVSSDALMLSGKIEESSTALTEGTSAVQSYVVQAMQNQADDAFGYFRALTEIKTFSDAIALQSSQSRKALDASLRQFKDLSVLMNDIVVKAAMPIRATLPIAKD